METYGDTSLRQATFLTGNTKVQHHLPTLLQSSHCTSSLHLSG